MEVRDEVSRGDDDARGRGTEGDIELAVKLVDQSRPHSLELRRLEARGERFGVPSFLHARQRGFL
jgi:hypothetical protein